MKRCSDPTPLPDIDLSDEEENSHDDKLHLLPIKSTDNNQNTLPSRGRCYSLYDIRLSVSQYPSKLRSTKSMYQEKPKLDFIIVPKFIKESDRRLRRLNTVLLESIKKCDKEEAERLLKLGASPNATCHLGYVSACHLAALSGGETLPLLIDHGAEKKRVDSCGRTPLHLAAWSGNITEIAILLDFPEALQLSIKDRSSSELEEEIIKSCIMIKDKIKVQCKMDEVNPIYPKDWLDNINHNCRDLQKSMPFIEPGWTALHAASSNAKYEAIRLLLAAGAKPNVRDYVGRSPLDVVGSAYYKGHSIDKNDFTEAIKLLVTCDIKLNKVPERKPFDTALHTAVELESLEAVTELLNNGASVTCQNRNGLTPLHICVNKKSKEHLQVLVNSELNKERSLTSTVDARNKNGHTVLHAAVLVRWTSGVRICLEAGANITAKDNNGETPIHLAAALGDIDILNEIINISKLGNSLDSRNSKGETPLFKAVMYDHIDSVKQLLKEGASVTVKLPRQVNVFHVAAELGYYDVLKVLLDHDYTVVTRSYVNFTTVDDKKGFGPIHFATWNNHTKCVKLLLSMNAYVSLRTRYGPHKLSTPLHLAAIKNNVDIAKILYKFDKKTIHDTDDMKWTPLHAASHNRSADVILFLLHQGADLSALTDGPNKMRKTAIDMIMDNLIKPTEFLEDVFDSYIINNNLSLHDSNYNTTIDYKILLPEVENSNQMKVLQALVETGNKRNQGRLFLHPLIESFLYLKWKGLVPYFYATLLLNGIFVITLSIFIISVFSYKDKDEALPHWMSGHVFVVIMYISAFFILIQDILHIIVGKSYYYLQIQTWVKFTLIILAALLPYFVTRISTKESWPRHVATVTLLLSWIQMMFMLSHFPKWGYYVLMFKKVSLNVLKILLMFAFLLIGFSLSFMIEFHSKSPFENPFAAFVKTMVMMTSEFDFEDLMNNRDLSDSFIYARVMFLGFLILTAIVLMNLMVGVAVNDLHNLQVQGNIQRLKMQVDFLISLENLVYSNIFKRILPKSVVNNNLIPKIISVTPNKKLGYSTDLPTRIKESAFNIGLQMQMQEYLGSNNINSKCEQQLDDLDYMHPKSYVKNKNVLNKLDAVQDSRHSKLTLEDVRDKLNETGFSIEMLNIKLDSILNRLDNISE